MDPIEKLRSQIETIEERLGLIFNQKELLLTALVHRSFLNEYRKESFANNERLEFLGDSVLNLVVADFLYHKLPDAPEGVLSQLRSRLVEANSCARYMVKLNLAEFLLLGRGEIIHSKGAKPSILADAFEAIVGAIYLDAGFLIAKSFLLSHYEEEVNRIIEAPVENYKAQLQDFSQRQYQKIPVYKIVEEMGPEHAKRFKVLVIVNDVEMGIGEGSSKKEAEQAAAKIAIERIKSSE